MPIRLSIELCDTQFAFSNSKGVDHFLRFPTGIPIEKKVYVSGVPSYHETEVKLFGVHDSSSVLTIAFISNCESCGCLLYSECEIKNTRILTESTKYKYSQRRPVYTTEDEHDVFLPNEWVCTRCIREAILEDTPQPSLAPPQALEPQPRLSPEEIDRQIECLTEHLNYLRRFTGV